MNPLVVAATVIGGQYIVESNGGWPAIVGLFRGASASSGDGTIPSGATPNVSQPGNTAAVAYLMGLGSIAGISVPPIDTSNANNASVSAIWSSIQPSVTSITDGAALATAFLGAYDAARQADPFNYSPFAAGYAAQAPTLGNFGSPLPFLGAMTPCSALTSDQMSSLGQAGCALASARDNYGSGNSLLSQFGFNTNGLGTIDNSQIIDGIATLASEMDAVGFTSQGDAPIDNYGTSIGTIADGVQYGIAKGTQAAVGAALDALEGLLGSAAKGAVAGLIGSNLVWAAGFAFLAWRVLK